MMRFKLVFQNDAGLTATIAAVPGSTHPDIVQVDSYGPSVFEGKKAWVFPCDNLGNHHVTVDDGQKKEKQIMSTTALRAFLSTNLMGLTEEETMEEPGAVVKKEKTKGK